MSKISRCPNCSKNFGILRWRHQCVACSQTRCNSCLIQQPEFEWLVPEIRPFEAGSLCMTCHAGGPGESARHYVRCEGASAPVEVFPATYRGKVADARREERGLATEWFRQRADAERQLAISAAWLGFNVVHQTQLEKDTRSEAGTSKNGTHHYTVWRANGRAAHRLA